MKNRMQKFFFTSILVLSIFSLSGAEIVRKGKVFSFVQLSENPSKVRLFAAEILAEHVKKMTGKTLAVHKNTGSSNNLSPITFVLLKEPYIKKFASLAQSGFAIDSKKDSLTIYGKRERAFPNAVYFLLREYAGVRYFHPRTPPYIPQKDSFIIPTGFRIHNPVFPDANITANGVWTTPEMMQNIAGMGLTTNAFPSPLHKTKPKFQAQYKGAEKLGLTDEIFWGGHILSRLLAGSDEKTDEINAALFKKHPEYFGLKNGKRVLCRNISQSREVISQPCLSNPAVKKRMLENARKVIERFGKNTHLLITLFNDDHYSWCECKNCTALDDPAHSYKGKYSDRWWDFVNFLAKNLLEKYPRLRIKVGAYQDYRAVPGKTKIFTHERLFVYLCPHGRCYLHSLEDKNCSYNGKYLKMLQSFWKTGIQSQIYEYLEVLPGTAPYLPIGNAYMRDALLYSKNSVSGMNYFIIGGAQPYYNGKYYQKFYNLYHWESLWLSAALLGYFNYHSENGDWKKEKEYLLSCYYGKGAEEMKEFHFLIEEAFRKNNCHASYGGSNEIFGKVYDTEGLAKKIEILLDKAMEKVSKDVVRLERIAKDALLWKKVFKESSFSNFAAAETMLKGEKASKISLDGKLDEPQWFKAQSVTELFGTRKELTVGHFVSEKMPLKTEVKLLYDKENIYFGIKAYKATHGKTMDVKKYKGAFPWNSSHLEIFIMTPELIRKGIYRQLAFTRNGISYDSDAVNMSNAKVFAEKRFEYAIKDGKEFWTSEVKIPLKDLGEIKAGTLWKVNVARVGMDEKGKMIIGAFTGKGGAFHTLSHFMPVSFGENAPVLYNGSFENHITKAKAGKNVGKNWSILGGKVPANWVFHKNYTALAECRKDSGSADGKYFLRIGRPAGESRIKAYPVVWQTLRIAGNEKRFYKLSLVLRGEGSVLIQINGIPRKLVKRRQFTVKSGNWKVYTAIFPVEGSRRKNLILQFSGKYVDMDNITLTEEKQ